MTKYLIAKSKGCFALPAAAARGLPGVWLTPVLTDPSVASAAALTAPALIVGGLDDPYWTGIAERTPSTTVVEIPGANHSLEHAGDIAATLSPLSSVVHKIERLIDTIENR